MFKLKDSEIPMWMKTRMSREAQEKTWVCQNCGVIEPGMLVEDWYYRRSCPCEDRARLLKPRQVPLRTVQEAVAQNQITQTYSWLGHKWREIGLRTKTFASFEQAHQPGAFGLALQFARKPTGTFLLHGGYGVGKTHLLSAIANQLTAEGKPCLFASAVTLFDAIQERINTDQDYHGLLKRAIATPLLLLDDIDKPKFSEFRKEMYYQIVDGRTRANRPIALSANCTLAELERFIGGATRSRLMIGLVPVEVEGVDYRAKMRG